MIIILDTIGGKEMMEDYDIIYHYRQIITQLENVKHI